MKVDPDEFGEFVAARGTQMFHTAYLLTGDRHMAEDLVQTTLGKLYVSWSRVQRADNPVAYSRTALARTFLDQRRKLRGETTTDRVPEVHSSDGDTVLRLALFEALRLLSERDRAIVVLRYWEDRSVDETAWTLGLRPGVVRTRCQRALLRLRSHLGTDASELIQP